MYLQLLNYIALFFIFLFFAFLFWALKWSLLKRFWKEAKIKAQNKKDKKDWMAKNEAKGLKPFQFDNGNTIIYAIDGNNALLQYKAMLHENKANSKFHK